MSAYSRYLLAATAIFAFLDLWYLCSQSGWTSTSKICFFACIPPSVYAFTFRCPSCGVNWIWMARRRVFHGDLHRCDRCGHRLK